MTYCCNSVLILCFYCFIQSVC